MTIVWLLLFAWHLNAHRLDCNLALALIGLFTLVLLLSGTETAYARRRAFLSEHLEPKGFLFRALRRNIALTGAEALKSAALALILVVGALTLAPRQWSLMFAAVLLLGLLLPRLHGVLAGQVREEYLYATARRWAMWVSTTLLLLESVFVLFFSATENFVGLRWQEVITMGAAQPDALCDGIASLARVTSAIGALGIWSVQNLGRSMNDLPQALMAAMGMVASITLSFLIAYAYSRALVGVVSRPWTMWRSVPRGAHAIDEDQTL
jgi:hypothetical protein